MSLGSTGVQTKGGLNKHELNTMLTPAIQREFF